MLHLLLVGGFVGLGACVALGVALVSDRLLGTFSPAQRTPVRVPATAVRVPVSTREQSYHRAHKETINV